MAAWLSGRRPVSKELIEDLLDVGRLAAVLDRVAAAETGDGSGRLRADRPARDVEMMREVLGALSAIEFWAFS